MNIEEMKDSRFTAPVEQYIAAVLLRNRRGKRCYLPPMLRVKDYILGVLILLKRKREFSGTIRELYKALSSIEGLTLPVNGSLTLSTVAVSILDSYGAINCESLELKNKAQGYIYKLSLYKKISAADLFEPVEVLQPEYEMHQDSYSREDPVIKHLFEGPYHLRLRSVDESRSECGWWVSHGHPIVTSFTLRQYLEECERNGEMEHPVLITTKKMTKREELKFTRRTLTMVHDLAMELETNQVDPKESCRRMKELVTYRLNKLIATKEAIRDYRSRSEPTAPQYQPLPGTQPLSETAHFIEAHRLWKEKLQTKQFEALGDYEEEQ
tara:strand:- start:169 stop:1143 length:975 start_codon:yes stop_codon:yes gene_type:complete